MKSEQEWKLVVYDNDYIQSFFEDGTCLCWSKDSITYHSTQGNRIQLSVDSIHHSQDMSIKVSRIVSKLNKYNDKYVDLSEELRPYSKPKQKFKKYKIEQFTWEQGIVRINNQGCYQIVSDDLNAKMSLAKDLYKINITHLQRVNGRRISSESVYLRNKNQKKMLLQKYNFQYVQFPVQNGLDTEVEYEYHQVDKEFTIFNLPERWYLPIKLIWGYILANELIKHSFCYIDFDDEDHIMYNKITTTKMPPFNQIFNKQQQEMPIFGTTVIPLYGKPNHSNKFSWAFIQRKQTEIIGYAFQQGNLICQNYGFWSIQGNNICFRTKNKGDYDYEVNINAFPIVLRLQGQPHRQIKNHIIALSNYFKHREYVSSRFKQQQSVKKQGGENLIIFEQEIEEVGNFKAFGNSMAVAKFNDKVIMTMKENQIKVISAAGKSYFINLTGFQPMQKQYSNHILYIKDFYQKVYLPQQWENKVSLNKQIDQRLRSTQAFLAVSQRFK